MTQHHPPMDLTIPTETDKSVVGYIVNASLSVQAQHAVTEIQSYLLEQFPDSFWAAPAESLHITLVDLLTPVTIYNKNTDDLYTKSKQEYLSALSLALEGQNEISVSFDTIEVFPSAVIIRGHDDGSFQRIRDKFMEQVTLLPGTKLPPTIIHSTIGKFIKPIPTDDVIDALVGKHIDIQEPVGSFRLARETKAFMLEYEVLKQFPLA